MACVYMATNLVNGKRYVGMTTRTMHVRRVAHINRSVGNSKTAGAPRLAAAIRKYGKDAFSWCVLADNLTRDEALAKEVDLIALLKPEYNVSIGGTGGGVECKYRKKVICLDDGEVYPSMTHAAAAYGTFNGDVSAACRGKKAIAGGKHFSLYERPLSEPERRGMILKIQRTHAEGRKTSGRAALGRQPPRERDAKGRRAIGPMSTARPVICLDDGQVYESASAAARAYGIAKSSLIELCLGKNARQRVGGLRFAYWEKTNAHA